MNTMYERPRRTSPGPFCLSGPGSGLLPVQLLQLIARHGLNRGAAEYPFKSTRGVREQGHIHGGAVLIRVWPVIARVERKLNPYIDVRLAFEYLFIVKTEEQTYRALL